MVTATLSKTEITIEEPVIEGRRIQLSWSEAQNRTTGNEVTTALQLIDGVQYAEIRYNYDGVGINLIERLVDPEAIARTAVYTVRGIISEGSAPFVVETRLKADGAYYTLQTDYRHTDEYLLKVLRQLGYNEVYFVDGDYSIQVYKPNGDFATIARKLRKTVNDFYNGTLPKQPLYYERTDSQDAERFELLFNRRIPSDQQRELARKLERDVPGLVDSYVDINGHKIVGVAANSLFSKNRVASQAAIIVEDFYKNLGKTD